MRRAIVAKEFSVVQWHGHEYPYYDEDAEERAYKVGDILEVLREAKPNPMGKLYVVYNLRTNESTVVHEDYIQFLDDEKLDDEKAEYHCKSCKVNFYLDKEFARLCKAIIWCPTCHDFRNVEKEEVNV